VTKAVQGVLGKYLDSFVEGLLWKFPMSLDRSPLRAAKPIVFLVMADACKSSCFKNLNAASLIA